MNKENKKKAVALNYEEERRSAPVVLAKGEGVIAENILSEAEKHQIPIQEDKTLVELLSKLNRNETIPEELYQVVAEVFAFIYQVDKQEK